MSAASWRKRKKNKNMNSEIIDRLVNKNIKLRNKRGALEAMKDGAYCLHGSWGFGRIKCYDEQANKLVIDFEGKPGHAMDPAFCADKLEILAGDNLLVRYRNDKDALEKEMKESGGNFVVKYIEKKESRAASQIELEKIMKQLFGYSFLNWENLPQADFDKRNKDAEKKYRAWWNKTKEELLRNPLVACPKTKNEAYVLREEEDAMKPEQEVLREYFLNREPKKKILLAEKLYKTAEGDDGKFFARLFKPSLGSFDTALRIICLLCGAISSTLVSSPL